MKAHSMKTFSSPDPMIEVVNKWKKILEHNKRINSFGLPMDLTKGINFNKIFKEVI